MTTAAIPHGTLSGRKYHKCACPPCMQAGRDYANNRHRQIAYGRWQPLTDAQPVRDHIRALMAAGIGWQRTAQLAGINTSVLERVLYEVGGKPRSRRIRADHAQRILAVQAARSLYPDKGLCDAIGTRRRLQALIAAGWPQRTLAAHLGIGERRVSELLQQQHVQQNTARQITDLYGQLRDLTPEDHGVTGRAALRARLRAERAGWPLPARWGADIDDPEADPDAASGSALVDAAAVERLIDGDPTEATREERMEAARVMTERGNNAHDIAKAIGVTSRTVVRWRTTHGWKAAA